MCAHSTTLIGSANLPQHDRPLRVKKKGDLERRTLGSKSGRYLRASIGASSPHFSPSPSLPSLTCSLLLGLPTLPPGYPQNNQGHIISSPITRILNRNIVTFTFRWWTTNILRLLSSKPASCPTSLSAGSSPCCSMEGLVFHSDLIISAIRLGYCYASTPLDPTFTNMVPFGSQ